MEVRGRMSEVGLAESIGYADTILEVCRQRSEVGTVEGIGFGRFRGILMEVGRQKSAVGILIEHFRPGPFG